MKTNALLLLASVSLLGCARDPAKDAPAADVKPAGTVATVAAPASPAEGAATPAASAGETLPIDVSASKLAWTGSKVTKVHPGGFKTFSGTITLVDGKPEASAVKVEIDVNSLYTDSPKLEGHLRSKDFFEVETFPKATFESTKITSGGKDGASHTVTGNLTMHGVTKEVSFPATITIGAKDVTAKAKFSINRKDWGIVYPGAPDDLIRDDVLIDWNIVAKRG